jgi:hypothetical protein
VSVDWLDPDHPDPRDVAGIVAVREAIFDRIIA